MTNTRNASFLKAYKQDVRKQKSLVFMVDNAAI